MTPNEMRSELLHIAAELVRGLHNEDVVFSKTTPWYVRARVEKVIDAADERSKALAMRLKNVADGLSASMRDASVELARRRQECGDCLVDIVDVTASQEEPTRPRLQNYTEYV